MATVETAPPSSRVRSYGPGPFLRIILPLFLLGTLLAGIGAAIAYALIWYHGRGPDRDLVWRRLEEPINIFGRELNAHLWLGILIPLLVLGLVYVIWMYVRDGVSIGWAWATFLAMLRGTVYALLAVVFLLPALQDWEETRSDSRVVVVFDVSGSHLFTRDEIPGPDLPLDKIPTRQDKVLRFLNDERAGFFKRLQEKNPVFAYRFGRSLDEGYLVMDRSGQVWTSKDYEAYLHNPQAEDAPKPFKDWGPERLSAWLKPELNPAIPESLDDKQRAEMLKQVDNLRRLTGATNLGTPLHKVFDREKNNLVQGIIVFTDGRNTEGSTQPLQTLIEDARKANPPVPIFVVAVGEDRERVRIEITDLRVPEQIRPEDRFRATVDLTGEGLVGDKRKVFLDIIRHDRKTDKPEGEIVLVETDAKGEPVGEPIRLGPQLTLDKEAMFLPGNPPHAQVEFPLDAATLAKVAGVEVKANAKLEFKDDAEGVLRFVARVARDPREDFAGKEHKSDAADVQVVKRPLRVLLMASGPMREYQFVRTLLVREMDKNRAEVSIYLQPVPGQEMPRKDRVQDVPPERLLTVFPDKLQDEKLDKPDEKFYNLGNYDVLLAFDPDWSRLSEQQLLMVQQWVDKGGGLIVVGGPINTLQLARPGAYRDKVKPMIDLYPVVLEDSRVQDVSRATDKPYRLNFPGATAEMEFLKLDEETVKSDKDDPRSQLRAWEEFFAGLKPGQDKPPPPDKTGLAQRGFYNFYPVKESKPGAIVVATFADLAARLKDGQEQPYLVISAPIGSGKIIWLGSAEMWRLRQYKEAYHERFWTKLARYAGSGSLTRLNRRIILNMGRTFAANNYINVEAQVLGNDLKPLPEKSRPRVAIKLPASLEGKDAPPEFDLGPKPTGGGEWNGWFAGRFMVKTPGAYGLELKVTETGDSATGKFIVKEANPELDNTRPDFSGLLELASEAKPILTRVDEATARELRERLQRGRPATSDAAKKGAASDTALRLYFDLTSADLIPACMRTEFKTARNRGASSDLWDSGFTLWNRDPPDEPVRMSTVLAVVVALLSVEWLTRKLLRLA